MSSVTRFPRPRLVRLYFAPWWRSWAVAYSWSVDRVSLTVVSYAVWSPRGPRRVWAF